MTYQHPIPEEMHTLPVSQKTMTTLSDLYDEPEWMRDVRQQAWARYQTLPLPHRKEEAWRRTPIQEYPLDQIRVVVPSTGFGQETSPNRGIREASPNEFPSCWQKNLVPDHQVSGTLVHYNGTKIYHSMRYQDQANGVILDDLHQVLALGSKGIFQHGDTVNPSNLIRRYWMQGSNAPLQEHDMEIAAPPFGQPDFNKFTALNAALWHGGTFVYVPSGVRVSRPLQSLIAYDTYGGSGLHHTLIIAEKGSHVSLIQDRISQEQQPEVNVEVVEIYAEEGAWVRYVSLQHWGAQRFSISMHDAELQHNTNLLWVSSTLGGRMSKTFMRSGLNAPGARSLMYGMTFGTESQHVDQSTYQHHRAPDTYSDLLFRNVLRDQARTVFYGMIRVEPEAAGAEGYQANNNLLLSDDQGRFSAHAHAIPGLEIRCNDVRCSHGATVTHIDPEQRFYLQARGIPQREAEHLIVGGFLQPIIERIPLAYSREHLQDEIARKQKTIKPYSTAPRP